MGLSSYYKATISDFNHQTEEHILGVLTNSSQFKQSSLEATQTVAWVKQIKILKEVLTHPEIDGILDKHRIYSTFEAKIYLEFSIPRLGSRADVILNLGTILIIIEFKVGQSKYLQADIDQVWDYALDLKNFHKTSHNQIIVPILCATEVQDVQSNFLDIFGIDQDGVSKPLVSGAYQLSELIIKTCAYLVDAHDYGVVKEPGQGFKLYERELGRSNNEVNSNQEWDQGSYQPTPSIIEAATALYNSHTVQDITRSDAGAKNLLRTSSHVQSIIQESREKALKSIIFVTGVPGAGKTLVGLNVATENMDASSMTHSVYLSGNGPLVDILREALARDQVIRSKKNGIRTTKSESLRKIKSFIQNVHHYRDEYLRDPNPPSDHVAIFDEAQRAWNREMTSDFMKRKKNQPDFHQSEPEYLISCLNRHSDWAVIVCLVGGGQEINRGEAGISEWLEAIKRFYPHWRVHISDRLKDDEYAAGIALKILDDHKYVHTHSDLHLSVSMRSFRAEHLSSWVKATLDINVEVAKKHYEAIKKDYPIVITRDLSKAKGWLRQKARGSERYGIVVSSQAERLKPLAIHVKTKINPVHWFLNDRDDVRSSWFLEDVVTEFQVQGLELDWVCVTWDADLRFKPTPKRDLKFDDSNPTGTIGNWSHHSFKGNKWQNIHSKERRDYQINAYRVLLTRARQGMIIVVPEGNPDDATRKPQFYDSTFEYLKGIGLEVV